MEINNIRNKLTENGVTITKAGKGKTIVILSEKYKQKVNSFIQDKQFRIPNNNPTQKYKETIKQVLKHIIIICQKKTE
jgi:hypothetical protein